MTKDAAKQPPETGKPAAGTDGPATPRADADVAGHIILTDGKRKGVTGRRK